MISQFPWRRWYYHIKHNYLTLNNMVLAAACVIGLGLAWNSVLMMQRNYDLQRKLDMKIRQQKLTELEVQTLEFQKRYHQSTEYQELAARQSLGLAAPGEKVLILPPNTAAADQPTTETKPAKSSRPTEPSNVEQWLDFLSGRNVRDLQQKTSRATIDEVLALE